MCHLTVM